MAGTGVVDLASAARPAVSPSIAVATIALTVIASLYNAPLALINAHAFGLSPTSLVLSEVLLLLGGAALIMLRGGFSVRDWPAVVLFYVFAMIALLVSITSDTVFIDTLRNIAIIAIFAMLGRRVSEAEVKWVFLILAALTLAVLILELSSLSTYVTIFQPASYYTATRGAVQSDFNDTGVFTASMGFAGRFNFGVFSGGRTSSIYLEQVSLANFAGILSIYLVTFWNRLSWQVRVLQVVTVVLILLSNNTRTSTGVALLSVIGFFVFPLLPRGFNLLIAPALLTVAFMLVSDTTVYNDDLLGRLSVTVRALQSFDLPGLFGARALASRTMLDTGYGYVIGTSGLVGFCALWLFVSLFIPQRDAWQKRCAYALATWFFVNMLIGGTAVFSMKVAAPLWLLVGFMARPALADAVTSSRPAAKPRRVFA